jgi:drug/metabolite transporter (DMT)-like permease
MQLVIESSRCLGALIVIEWAVVNQAAFYLFLATLFYALINVGVKYLGHIPASEVVLFRAFVSMLICSFFIYKKKLSFWGKNKPVLLLRGFFGTLALFTLFLCLQKIPLAVAMTLLNLSPIFTVIIAHFVLKEKASPIQWLLLLVCFIGVYLVRGEIEPVPLLWIGVGLSSALFAAMAYTCVRVLRLSEDPLVVIFYFTIVTVPLIGPLASYQWRWPTPLEWALLVTIGALTQVAQYYMTVAYQLQTAARVMVFNYFGLFWGVILGWALFNESLTWKQLGGVTIVFLCLCTNYWHNQRPQPIDLSRP